MSRIRDEFADFYRDLHAEIRQAKTEYGHGSKPSESGGEGKDQSEGREAYRWQKRFVEELAAGEAIDLLDVPTGCGKTTAIECFLFALAWQLRQGDRHLPLRLFWVVDRRSVIDQVFDHAAAVAAALERSSSAEVRWVRDELAKLDPKLDGGPVQVRRWRGGTGLRPEPISPAAPAVICSTVDQIGSRMLFRGYGVSFKTRPVDAALTATDSLIILDEAHIARPFLQTARAIADYQRRAPRCPVRPLRVIRATATPDDDAAACTFRLTEDEREELEERLEAAKAPKFVRPGSKDGGLPGALVREAIRLADQRGGVIGVIANTVADARSAFERLRRERRDAILVIGPVRPADRARLLERIPGRGAEDRPLPASAEGGGPASSASDREPLFVVATQTIEVGLDLDFDSLVTAAAPLSSLTQRLGRLDRGGKLGKSHVVIVDSKKCPVYGPVAGETFKWLRENAGDSLGPSALERLRELGPPQAADETITPRLMPWHLDALVCTSEQPEPDPEIGVFLHGDSALELPDVQIAWRGDLRGDPGDAEVRAEWEERVRARPPHVEELLQLPFLRARRWLAGKAESDFADLEGSEAEGEVRGHDEKWRPRPFVIVNPPDADDRYGVRFSRDPRDLRPGAVVVVPASVGGCDEFGWAPASKGPVDDLGDLDLARPRFLLDGSDSAEDAALVSRTVAAIEDGLLSPADAYKELAGEAQRRLVARAQREVEEFGVARSWEAVAALFGAEEGTVIPVPRDDPRALVIRAYARREAVATVRRAMEGPFATVTGSIPQSQRPKRQRYADHVEQVVEYARAYAEALDLDDDLREVIAWAARYHDLGKLEPRFQAWLNGGSPLADVDRPLAKSAIALGSTASERARIAAGWPRGLRHEAASAQLAEKLADLDGAQGMDLALALYLILVHHGCYRPYYRARDRIEHQFLSQIRIDGRILELDASAEPSWAEHAQRFAEFNKTYSPWGLAALESILVLADRCASSAGGERKGAG